MSSQRRMALLRLRYPAVVLPPPGYLTILNQLSFNTELTRRGYLCWISSISSCSMFVSRVILLPFSSSLSWVSFVSSLQQVLGLLSILLRFLSFLSLQMSSGPRSSALQSYE